MKKVIAGYFDSEDEATRAMDQLLKDPRFRDAESQVFSSIASSSENTGGLGVTPVVPNTGAVPGGTAVVGPVPAFGGNRLFRGLEREEAEYFQSAMRNGRGVLALIEVEDELAAHVGQIFNQTGARTFQKNA